RKITCIILLKEQPSETVARDLKLDHISQDKGLLRKLIYTETKKKTLPIQNSLITPISTLGGKILQNYFIINALLVEIPLQALPQLAELSQIARIEPDYTLHLQLDVSQPIVTNTTAPGWNYLYNGSGVIVAVCDTGINKNHPALVGRVIAEASFIGGTPDDSNGHGTHVAGIIASNDSTYHGIASEVSLVNVKIMNSEGLGQTSDLIEGLEWLFNGTGPGADIINLSAGTDEIDPDGESSLARFIDAIVSQYGIVWVNAAGNSGSSGLEVPGDAINCISVANFDDHDSRNPSVWTINGLSSRGPTLDGRKKPDIAAPGTDISSCDLASGFVEKTGTSMAAPHVAGAAALLWQYLSMNNASLDSSWYPLIIKGIMLNTAYDLGTAGYDYSFGYGAIDLGAAWNFLQTGDFAVETMNYPNSQAKYRIILDTPQKINVTVVWNRYASTNYTHTFYYGLSNINIELKNETGSPLASSLSLRDNVEQISYTASNGTYYLYINIVSFAHDPQEYVVVSSSPLTFIEKIRTWDLFEILLYVSIGGVIAVAVIYVAVWLRDRRKGKLTEEAPPEADSTWPEWLPAPNHES
ncbi:MAG: S8 family serine peptidase, partial [Promethearchaeota archaeon]